MAQFAKHSLSFDYFQSEGSVFGACFSPVVELGDADCRVLVWRGSTAIKQAGGTL